MKKDGNWILKNPTEQMQEWQSLKEESVYEEPENSESEVKTADHALRRNSANVTPIDLFNTIQN